MTRTRSTLTVAVVMAAIGLMAGPVWASPYDNPYGIQWNFMIGNAAADNPATLTVSPDETVWIGTMGTGKTGTGPALTWGNPTNLDGGHYASGYGQISPQGWILQGNDLKAIPGNSGHNQGYSVNVAFAGSDPKAYISYSPNNQPWTDAVPPDTSANATHPKTWTVTSLAGGTQYDYDGTPGATPNALAHQITSGISPMEKYTMDFLTAAYGGSAHDSKMGSDGISYYFARGAQIGATDPLTNGDLFTVGDFSGPAGQSYKPAVGKAVVTNDGVTVTTTLSGPEHQPSCGGRSFFGDIDINETAGKVYAAGYGYNGSGGTMDHFDPDGPGPLPTVNFNSGTPSSNKGFAVVYDSTTWGIQKVVTWESTQGGEGCFDITATPDGGFVVVGATQGNMGGNTNPAPGTREGYMEKYNADGSLAWNYQTQTAYYDYFGDVTVDADGTIWVSGSRDLTGSEDDPVVWKFTSGGALALTTVVDNAGTHEYSVDHGNVGKDKVYVLSEHNPGAGGTPWTNSISYAQQGTDENLLQKLSAGDFDTDGYTNWDDMNAMIDTLALAGGSLPGDDTYDFNEDGDSTFGGDFKASGVPDDLHYFMKNIFDSDFGDFNWDGIKGDPGDYALLGGWQPGDAPIPLPAGWRGFAGPDTPNLVDLEEWLYLNDLAQEGFLHIFKFLDADGDGIQDPGEDLLDPGSFFFEIYNEAGELVGTFPNCEEIPLPPGAYTGLELLEGDWFATTPNPFQFEIFAGELYELYVGNNVPEPATLALLGLAACGLGGYVRRRRKA